MKHYSQLTLLASSVLSFGLQAAVVETALNDHYQVSESVSRVVYKSQKTTSVSSTPVPLKKVSSIEAQSTRVKHSTDEAVLSVVKTPQSKQIPASAGGVNKTALSLPLPAKITSVSMVSVSSLVRSNSQLPLATFSEPAVKPTMQAVIMPTPVHPILNTAGLARPEANEKQQEPSLFSAISDWFSVKPVKPWQKGTLAKKAMKPGGEVPEFDFFSEKVFAYKQGSIGGNGVGGGGCGCN
ncbi:DUF4266 domain-containing protein [Moritella sp. Urea-trap-13]|uniref:DUF4266 domain-containing protein n=1 Tax=Moritella sp. Urea-trap-13 TaxID=2058327 RepID=UPI000C34D682|nr:DUF4266 domain-containing protein [Moritella sp. Urea-trap-13]PKH05946.1 hypothetical protein CXF93_08370 [Moritella sp. Urea-trap-13]